MNARQIRRAAERQALKAQRAQDRAAEKALNPSTQAASAGPSCAVKSTASQAQINANRANSQLSTGPKTETGRAVSSQNALKTALTGRTVLLPTDNVEEYESLQDAFLNTHQPATEEERELVQSLLDTTWRIKRILSLEFAIFAKGSVEFADSFPDLTPDARNQMILAETYLKYEKSIRNLNTQEARLQRKLAKDLAELTRLQAERRQAEAQNPAKSPAQTPEIGFVFSNLQSATASPIQPEAQPAQTMAA
jgi:hypothetical protein